MIFFSLRGADRVKPLRIENIILFFLCILNIYTYIGDPTAQIRMVFSWRIYSKNKISQKQEARDRILQSIQRHVYYYVQFILFTWIFITRNESVRRLYNFCWSHLHFWYAFRNERSFLHICKFWAMWAPREFLYPIYRRKGCVSLLTISRAQGELKDKCLRCGEPFEHQLFR